MDFAPRLIYRFAIPAVALLLMVVLLIIPLGKSAYNSVFGEKVTVEYRASVVSIDGDQGVIEWNEDEIVIATQGNTYVPQRRNVDLNTYKQVKIGDTFTVAVTEPGLMKKLGTESQRTVEVKKHDINFFKSTWRKLFG
ncbi:hypothetical protein SAMN03159341_14115 [Paenibacillus sp. 1_12]|uniref:hypothetical protein n=1 Tax=Paenibacillus sp. 1_12 TaxID=1566278 RepID=UPI0008E08142|nr:hypothetical protein [Paenibacillus sp. 1_12]SFM51554.1 hypothetical protein SAMN03159341_14115 [Paenibacillus sp. 1_12]